jgi:hypothetical protein
MYYLNEKDSSLFVEKVGKSINRQCKKVTNFYDDEASTDFSVLCNPP